MPTTQTEWRVTFILPHDQEVGRSPIVERCPNEQFARRWADLERRDYPHAIITIERRQVTPWGPA